MTKGFAPVLSKDEESMDSGRGTMATVATVVSSSSGGSASRPSKANSGGGDMYVFTEKHSFEAGRERPVSHAMSSSSGESSHSAAVQRSTAYQPSPLVNSQRR